MSGPLAGLRVLDLTRLLPGNYCSLLLADLGADVVKVEEPGGGDYIRWIPPLVDGMGATHRALNRGKRSVTINLKKPEGADLLDRMAADAEVLLESFRPGVMDRLGVGYETLASRNPALVYCAITGFGQDGPYRDRAGHDINYTGYAGILDATGTPDGPPVLPSVQVGDLGGAMAAAIGLLAALIEARATGRGRLVDVSMLDVTLSWGARLASLFLATGEVPGRGATLLSGGYACYQVYRAADGKYVSVGAIEPQFWAALCHHLGVPELTGLHFEAGRQDEVKDRLQEVFASRPRDEWIELLADLDTCVGPVNDIEEALRDPQAIHRSMLAEAAGRAVGPGPAIKLSGESGPALRPAPDLGEHTEEVLGELGLDAPEIAALRDRGAI